MRPSPSSRSRTFVCSVGGVILSDSDDDSSPDSDSFVAAEEGRASPLD